MNCLQLFKQEAMWTVAPAYTISLFGFGASSFTRWRRCVLPTWRTQGRCVWLFGPRGAGEGHQARKHGYGDVLPEPGLASTPQQASADVFL